MPTSSHVSCFMRDVVGAGRSSPTRIVPSPGVTPARRRPSPRPLRVSSSLILAYSGRRRRAMIAAMSVLEVAFAGEDHGDAVLVGGGDDLVVAHRAAGLDDCRDARRRPRRRGRRGTGRTRRWRTRRRGPDRRPSRPRCAPASTPVLLAGADADGLAVLDQHDGVGRHPRHDPPRQLEVGPLVLGGLRLRSAPSTSRGRW